jgi:hypothetical protein
MAKGHLANIHLILPFDENPCEAVGKLIDREAWEGKILLDENINVFSDEKKAYWERIILTPSYLLFSSKNGDVRGTSQVTAIPRDKIYWICAQAGRSEGTFIARLLIFTEQKLFCINGVDNEHVQEVANKLYEYIPNIYSCFDPIYLSYVLGEAIVKAPEAYTKSYARYAQNWEADRNACENLRRSGDALSEPREIDFFIRFKKESDIDGVAEKLLEQGFTEAGRGKTENGEYGLSLTLNAIPELPIINNITSEILSILAYTGAAYDGWACAVVRENVFSENSQIGI